MAILPSYATDSNKLIEQAIAMNTGALPVEIVSDIVCYALSSYCWDYFIEGKISYKSNQPSGTGDVYTPIEGGLFDTDEQLVEEWDPITTLGGVNLIFREQTLKLASKILGIPRAVNGSLLEHPRKVTTRLYLLRLHLNLLGPSPSPTTIKPHPLLSSSPQSTYFPPTLASATNPWSNTPRLMLYIQSLLTNGYISKTIFLRAYVALMVGKSALETLSFGEVVRTGLGVRREREGQINDNREENNQEGGGERSPAAWALEIMNKIIPSLSLFTPRQVCAHLCLGMFGVAYSLHTISAICGIVGVVTSCTKLMVHLRAVESIVGIDGDRRRSLQTATRACTMSLNQLHTCESGSYNTYRALGVPNNPPKWPEHIITHEQILSSLTLAGPEDLFPSQIRQSLLQAAVIWTFRVKVPGMSQVFPDEMVRWKEGVGQYGEYDPEDLSGSRDGRDGESSGLRGIQERDERIRDGQKLWGGIDCRHWGGTRGEFLSLWEGFETKLRKEFRLDTFGLTSDNAINSVGL